MLTQNDRMEVIMKPRTTKSGLTLFRIYEQDIVNGVLTIPEGVTKIN